MKKSILVADSGGSQTDWCFVDASKNRKSFTTKSFHPSNWNSDFFKEFDLFWSDKSEMKNSEVSFYGAGCLSSSNKEIILDYFLRWGFTKINVFSDVEGACHALFGNEKGTVAILGTGSVLCHYNGETINEIRGGFGYLLGDEGSGYYFGKLLVQAYLNNEFSARTMNDLSLLLGDRSEILKKVYGIGGKDFLSSISKIISENLSDNKEFLELHKSNVRLFIERYLYVFTGKVKTISIVGSYGYFNFTILAEELVKKDIKLTNCIQYPINNLTDYILKTTFKSTKTSF